MYATETDESESTEQAAYDEQLLGTESIDREADGGGDWAGAQATANAVRARPRKSKV